MLSIWHRLIDTLISLLVPPLSDLPSKQSPVTPSESEIIFKWLQSSKSVFNAREGETEHGIPMAKLQGGGYKDIVMLGQYMDLPSAALKDRASAAVRAAGKGGSENERMAEVLLRIVRTRWVCFGRVPIPSVTDRIALRSRSDLGEFLSQQVAALNRAKVERYSAM